MQILMASQGKATAREGGAAAAMIDDVPRLIGAMDRFCSEHTNFESSTVGGLVHKAMAASSNMNQAALVPLQHKIFDFDSALKWGFFLMNVIPRILAEDGVDATFPFDVAAYYNELVDIYDIAVEAAVWDLCEEDDDSDESDD